MALKKEFLKNVPIHEVKPYENNPRKISKDKLAGLVQSIKDDGFLNPIRVDEDNVILAGHQRLKALEELGYEFIPDVMRISGLTDEQKKRHRILDNNDYGEFEFQKLYSEIETLGDAFDFSKYSFEFVKGFENTSVDDEDLVTASDDRGGVSSGVLKLTIGKYIYILTPSHKKFEEFGELANIIVARGHEYADTLIEKIIKVVKHV